jgi:uncharacterized low-complexity protein
MFYLHINGDTLMSNKKSITTLSIAAGTAFVASLAIGNAANAAQGANPFAMTELSSGYMQLAEAKCGGNMKDSKDMKEGKCGGDMKGKKGKKEGKCGGDMKGKKEGKCGGDMKDKKKMKEGKCGEGKCGGKK